MPFVRPRRIHNHEESIQQITQGFDELPGFIYWTKARCLGLGKVHGVRDYLITTDRCSCSPIHRSYLARDVPLLPQSRYRFGVYSRLALLFTLTGGHAAVWPSHGMDAGASESDTGRDASRSASGNPFFNKVYGGSLRLSPQAVRPFAIFVMLSELMGLGGMPARFLRCSMNAGRQYVRQKLPNICTGSQTWLLEHCSPGTCYGLEPTMRYCILSHRRPPSPCMVSGAGCGLTHAWSVSHRLACVSRRSLTWMHTSAWRTIRFAQERNQTRALQDGLYGRPASGAEGTLGSWAERCVSVQCSSLAGSSPMRSRRR